MPMTPLMERFPELGARETRPVTVRPCQELPREEYGFLELYCNEPGCDCRRCHEIAVLRPEPGCSKIWATIGYGWESLDFYRKWGGPASDPTEIKGPYLDPTNPQTKYLPALLNLCCFLLQFARVRGTPSTALPDVRKNMADRKPLGGQMPGSTRDPDRCFRRSHSRDAFIEDCIASVARNLT